MTTGGGESGFIEAASLAARLAGRHIVQNLGGLSKDDVGVKSAYDFVTRVDRESENLIIETIRGRFPGHSIMAEESPDKPQTGRFLWIIDPLDGTTNFIHSYPVFSVSIALQKDGDLVLGVVFDPLRDELFTAEKGGGAYLNGSLLRASGVGSLGGSLITTGFPFRQKHRLDLYLEAFRRIFLKASGIRRAGSAALDLAYLAAGRCEGFFELGLAPWDVAAGSLLVEEAGGVVTDFGGGRDYLKTGNVVAGNREIQNELLSDIRAVFGGIIDR